MPGNQVPKFPTLMISALKYYDAGQVDMVDLKEKGKIVDVIEKGYLLSNKVIRYTKVVVAN